MLTQILLDAPGTIASRIQVAKIGEFKHGKHGKLTITRDEIQDWQRNLAILPGHRAPIDLDHSSERDRATRNTEAAGWITGITLEGDTPMADVEWTPVGQKAIEEKRYLFFSPTFGTKNDEQGEPHENVLQGGALTNRPFLNMPTITLASDERVSEWLDEDHAARLRVRMLDGDLGELGVALITLDDVPQAERDQAVKENNALPDGSYPIRNTKQLHAAAVLAASKHGNWQAAQKLIRRRAKELGVDVTTLPGFAKNAPAKTLDSPAAMELKDIATALGLDETSPLVIALDAIEDETEQAAAIEAAKPKTVEPTQVKTLDEQAADEGKVVLDADEVQQLRRGATAGEAAMKQLHEQTFNTAFDKALGERKVVPAERENFEKLYELDDTLALTMLDSREPIMPNGPAGAPSLEYPKDGGDAPKDPHAELTAQVHKYMLDNQIPQNQFVAILDQFVSGNLVLS